MKPWLAVIGIGEDGVAGLAPAARALVETAEVLVGGVRHLAWSRRGRRAIVWGGHLTVGRLTQSKPAGVGG